MARKRRDTPEFKLVRRKNSSYWYVYWSIRRKPCYVSTGTADETEAHHFLREYRRGWITPYVGEALSVETCIDLYLKHKKHEIEVADQPTRNYKELEYTLNPIKERLGSYKVEALNRAVFRDVTKEWQKAKLKAATIRKRWNIFTATMNHAEKEELIKKVPHKEKPDGPPPRDLWMHPDQAKAFFKESEHVHVKLFCMLAFHTLSRRSAILELTWDRVYLDQDRIDFHIPGRTRSTKRRVMARINTPLKNVLEEALEFAVTDYVIEFNKRRVASIQRLFSAHAEKVEMPWVTPHVLRHTGATLLAQKGMPIWEIAGLLGDTAATTDKKYAHHDPEHLKSTTDALADIYNS